MNIYGIDTNHHHPVTDWNAVADWLRQKNGGAQGFNIVRLGYSARSGNGGLIMDRIALDSLAACNRVGIPCGVYVYCYDASPAAARITMQQAMQAIKGFRIEMPVIYDMEYGTDDGTVNGYCYNSTAHRGSNTEIIKAAMSIIEQAGYYGMLYCSRNFFLNYTDLAALSGYDKWEAAYTQEDTAAVPNGIWQYASNGSVPGITGPVDLNVAYKDYPAMIRAAGLNHLAPIAKTLSMGATGRDLEAIVARAIALQVKCVGTITVGPMTGQDIADVVAVAAQAGITPQEV